MQELVRELEALGPDTANLANHFGLQIGPCTAGVLRGERAPFQVSLFLLLDFECL